jgi:hypothetical protein
MSAFGTKRAFYNTLNHALRLLHSRAVSAWQVSQRILSVRRTFFLQAKKVSKKARSTDYVLHPIIYEI